MMFMARFASTPQRSLKLELLFRRVKFPKPSLELLSSVSCVLQLPFQVHLWVDYETVSLLM